ncbi:site-specific integrase [Pseudobacteroides cellulosolvens]|uniref:Integrase family protein n=1 Tax=Pseudobacteroides cellulosolvens ATCC 35603 = DSM 2933 TaxID=398512 RepID=A0A0L6JPF8_9FIRM|nr:site-specific integrase [Pseudobacteroides cellulosolvens]KNY27600.1 integrase family protein [Pseudobacteroides cellulosolvens ATCC 35603 = DSM 2933]
MKYVQPIRDLDKLEEIKKILKRESYRNYFLFILGINTGLRISDILKLKVADVKSKSHIIIKEEKTDKNKRFKINLVLQNEIEEYTDGLNPSDYLFPSRNGSNSKPITRFMAYNILNRAAKKVGIDEIGTHTLRKTFGYHFYQKTKDVAMLQELFNHSAPSVTLRYIGINQDMMDEAIDSFSL